MRLSLIVGLVVLVCSTACFRKWETVPLKGQTEQQRDADRAEFATAGRKSALAEHRETDRRAFNDLLVSSYVDCLSSRGYQVNLPK